MSRRAAIIVNQAAGSQAGRESLDGQPLANTRHRRSRRSGEISFFKNKIS
jgi:hypothetical protein